MIEFVTVYSKQYACDMSSTNVAKGRILTMGCPLYTEVPHTINGCSVTRGDNIDGAGTILISHQCRSSKYFVHQLI